MNAPRFLKSLERAQDRRELAKRRGEPFQRALLSGEIPPIKSGSYLAWVRTLPCATCGRPGPSEVSHVAEEPFKALGSKVSDYLEKSEALARIWDRPVTAAQLQAELDRMAEKTRHPALLRELFAALVDDPFVIAETLVRQKLVERIFQHWYAFDCRLYPSTHIAALHLTPGEPDPRR